MKQLIKDIFAQLSYMLYRSNIKKNVIKVHTVDETIKELLRTEKSMIRFGDGEIVVIGGKNLKLQKMSPEISEGLKRILKYEHDGLIVTIPEIFGDMSLYRKESRQFWKEHLLIYRGIYDKYCNLDRIYYSTSFSRFYYAFTDKRICERWAEQMKQIWKDKDLVVVEGERTHNGVGNDLLSTAKSVERIIGPASNAYDRLNEILDCCRNYSKDRMFLVSLGVAAKFIVERLFLEGYRALDIGNLDMEYEWYIRREKKKTTLPKHEIIGIEANKNAGYEEYLGEIKFQIS
ncbi:MAG: GT-D fold domain-containing glycosyltransferase [Clostridium sp.]|nr:GT-D fold domain-containing glycosyltransferase [Clostridium sp.]